MLPLVGVALRWMALASRGRALSHGATALVALGAVAVVVAVATGEEARVVAEEVPGTSALVAAHAAWGARTRGLVLGLAALELLTIVRPAAAIAAAVGGLAVAASVAQVGWLGGELVYAHAPGVGARTGDPADVARLLLAGLGRQAAVDRLAGRPADAAELLDLAARRFPDEPGIQIDAAESALDDRGDPVHALAVARATEVPTAERDLRFRRGWLLSRALAASGDAAGARAALEELAREFPDSARVRRRLAAETPARG
jgi:hypothetical protein